MKKLRDLRIYLAAAIPLCKKHPDKLHVMTDKGAAVCSYGSLSHEWRYDAKILITDFADPVETITVPLLAWIEKNQPELLLDPNKLDSVIAVEAEILDHDKADVLITVSGITERILVTAVEGGYQATHVAEPALAGAGTDTLTGWPADYDGTGIFVEMPLP